MFNKLKIGDKICLSGGYDMEPKWLSGKTNVIGTLKAFIPGQNDTSAAVVELDEKIACDGMLGKTVVLELRHQGAKWQISGTVHVELCDFEPEAVKWQLRKQGKWVESHASYKKLQVYGVRLDISLGNGRFQSKMERLTERRAVPLPKGRPKRQGAA